MCYYCLNYACDCLFGLLVDWLCDCFILFGSLFLADLSVGLVFLLLYYIMAVLIWFLFVLIDLLVVCLDVCVLCLALLWLYLFGLVRDVVLFILILVFALGWICLIVI